MTEQEILEQLRQIAAQVLGRTDFELTEKTKLQKTPQISSFARVQLICAVEDAFDISIPNSAIKSLKDVKSLIRFIQKNQ